jgi:hypothetical protein
MRSDKTHALILTFREVRPNLRICKQQAERKWSKSVGLKIEKVKGTYPRRFWKQKNNLQAGLTGHHVKRISKRFAKGNGTQAMNDTDDIKILSKHFEKVYNRDSSFDPGILKKVRRRAVIQDFAQSPTRDELTVAIKKMNLLAAPGESGLSPAAMKKLSDKQLQRHLPPRCGREVPILNS